ncbi:MAG: autotransporter domain-containing protein, partial [Pseudomonadota bacterium]
LINATEDGTIGGTFVPVLQTLQQARPYVLIDVDGTSADAGTFIQDTVVLDFEIGLNNWPGDGSTIDLLVATDYDVPGTNKNQAAVAQFIDKVLLGDGSVPLGTLFAFIGTLPTEAAVIAALDNLTTQDYAATQIEVMNAGLRFADDMFGCEGLLNELEDGGCFSFSAEANDFSRSATSDFRALDATSGGIRIQRESYIDQGDLFAVSFGYGAGSFSNGDNFSANSQRFQLGAGIYKERTGFDHFWVLSGSYTEFDAERGVGVSTGLPGAGVVETTQPILETTFRAGMTSEFALGQNGTYFAPEFSFDLTYLRSFENTESGATVGAKLSETEQLVLTINPSIEIGMNQQTPTGRHINSFVRGGLNIASTDTLFIDSTLAGVSEADGTFRNISGFDDLRGQVELGIELYNTDRTMFFEAGYAGEFGSLSNSHSLSASFGLQF